MNAARRALLGSPSAGRSSARAVADRRGVHVHLSGFSGRIVSDCSRVLSYLTSLYPTAVVESTDRGVATDPPFAVVERLRTDGGGRYRLTVEGADVGRFETAPDVVAHLEYLVNAAAAMDLGRFLLLHAGAVGSAGAAVLLPGASGVGKSTLVTALSLSGFQYLSDELAVVDPGSVAACPFLKPICLKEGGWRLLAAMFDLPLALHAIRADGQRVHYLRPPRPCPPESSLPIRYIVTPLRRVGATAELTACSRARALAELAKHSLNLPRHGPAGLELLAQVVERAACYTLSYDTVLEAVALVSSLLGHTAVRSDAS